MNREMIKKMTDLRYVDLEDVDLTGTDLTGADLTGAILYLSDLKDCIISYRDMKNMKMCTIIHDNQAIRQDKIFSRRSSK